MSNLSYEPGAVGDLDRLAFWGRLEKQQNAPRDWLVYRKGGAFGKPIMRIYSARPLEARQAAARYYRLSTIRVHDMGYAALAYERRQLERAGLLTVPDSWKVQP